MHEIDKSIIVPKHATLTYDRYLKIDELLSLQNPMSSPAEHDETLFIVIHQVYELWFKQILHEVNNCYRAFKSDELMAFLRSAKRITKIQEVLIHQIDILETMTPNDFNTFRNHLNPASGFQSYQFRLLEFRLGSRDAGYLKFFQTEVNPRQQLERALQEPSLYDELLRLMARRGHKIPQSILDRDVSKPYESNADVLAIMLAIYQDARRHYDLYMALEAMIDIDEHVTLWRYRHIAMVERMIGAKRGTGGSSGAKYLATTLTKRFFPEIWELRNNMGGSGYS